MLHAITMQPVYVRGPSADLRCDVRRTVAYRAKCSCGWIGKARGTVQAARIEHRLHREELTAAEIAPPADAHGTSTPTMLGGIP